MQAVYMRKPVETALYRGRYIKLINNECNFNEELNEDNNINTKTVKNTNINLKISDKINNKKSNIPVPIINSSEQNKPGSQIKRDIGCFQNLYVENKIIGATSDYVAVPKIDTTEITNFDLNNQDITIKVPLNGGYDYDDNLELIKSPLKISNGIILLENTNVGDNGVLTKKETIDLVNNLVKILIDDKIKLIERVNELESKILSMNKDLNNKIQELIDDTYED